MTWSAGHVEALLALSGHVEALLALSGHVEALLALSYESPASKSDLASNWAGPLWHGMCV